MKFTSLQFFRARCLDGLRSTDSDGLRIPVRRTHWYRTRPPMKEIAENHFVEWCEYCQKGLDKKLAAEADS